MTTKISGVDELLDSAGDLLVGLTIETRDWEVIGRFSGSAVANIDSSFWAADLYSEIEVVINDMAVATNTTDLLMRISTDGSTFDSGASDYEGNLKGSQNSGADFEVENVTDSGIQLTEFQSNAAGTFLSGRYHWMNAETTGEEPYMIGLGAQFASTRFVNLRIAGRRDSNAAVRGVQIVARSGNITGTFVVRGRRLDPTQNAVFLKESLFHVRDEKAAGVSGGTFNSGSFQTRDLNAEVTNQITGASLSANQLTLPAGTYYIEASAPANETSQHIAKLRNITDNTDEIIGTTGFAHGSDNGGNYHSFVTGEFTITGTKTFEIQHQAQITVTTDGFGVGSTSFSVITVYTDVRIWQREDQQAEVVVGTLHVRQEETAGTDGGGATSGSFATRTLNTILTNTITGASLASDQITLPAGTYEIEAIAPAYRVARNKAKLRNFSDSSDVIIGTGAYSVAAVGQNEQVESFVRGRFTITSEKDFEIQHRVETTNATNGFGVESNFGVTEVFTEVIIRRLAQ